MARLPVDERTQIQGIYTDAWIHDGDKPHTVGSNPSLSVDVANLPITSFGEVAVAERTPIIQIYGQNGIRDDVLKTEVGTGSVTNSESMFVCDTGADAGSVAALLSAKQCTYRAGQGMVGLCTAIFDDPTAGYLQLAGFINSEDFIAVGYNGLEFGLQFGQWGALEYQELIVSTPAGGTETATVTVNGVGYSVDLTGGTADHNAYEIASQLQGVVPNYNFSSNANVVSALSTAPVPGGAFAFSSATAVALWAQIVAGSLPTVNTYALDPEVANWLLDPKFGNVFQLKVKYLGFGSPVLFIEHPDDSKLKKAAIIPYPNRNTRPLWGNPTFRIGWGAQSVGGTGGVTIKGASAGAFIEGKIVRDERPRTLSGRVASIPTAVQRNLITIRNRLHLNNRANRVELFSLSLWVATTASKTAFVHVDINPSVSGDLIYSYLDQTSSVVEYATSSANITGGREIITIPITASDGAVEIPLGKYFSALFPSETLSVSIEVDSGASYTADYSLIWQEDP